MSQQMAIDSEFQKIQTNLRNFIDLSLKEDEISWSGWISSIASKIDLKCWEEKKCEQHHCPAYLNECGRCWIIAGTMCGGEVQGKFAKKYDTCKECDLYRHIVYSDPIREIEEHLIVLVHSLRCKHQEVKEISFKDHLTGLFNRRYFDYYITHESHKIKRSNSTLTIMMIDINNFKQINDTFGHTKGDEILKICSKLLQSTARQSDIVFRIGGDEFCIIMHECSYNENYANALISRIDSKLDHFNTDNEMKFNLSLSYGFSFFTKTTTDIQKSINEADEKMYEDKKIKKLAFRTAKHIM